MPLPALFRPTHFRALVSLLGVAAVAALGFAWISQYGFGLRPCHLCLWQRWPYATLGIIGATTGLWRAAPGRALWVAALALLVVEVGLATYHSAVERHLVEGPGECASGVTAGMDLAALRAKILGATVTRCDEPTWLVRPLSMANGNMLFALAILAYAMAYGRKILSSQEHVQ